MPPYEGVHLVLIWHHRPPLVSQTWQRSASCTSPLVFHLILGLRPQIIVLRLDEGNQQQIYRGHVYTTPLMVGDGHAYSTLVLDYLATCPCFSFLLVHWFGHRLGPL